MSKSQPRIMLYSHDTYGLGHLRRSLSIANQLALDIPNASQLLVTGSIIPDAFGIPDRLDLIKLPAISKHSNGQYKSRTLPLSISQIIRWREQMIMQAAIAYQPDLLLVDKSPAGVQQELLPTLRHLKTQCPETRIVLGMRDIEDSPEATKAEWDADGIRQLHDEVYDWILLYGQCEIFDPAIEYNMSPTAIQKLIPVGYLGNVVPLKTRQSIRRELKIGDQSLILVTVGGGGDGFEVIKAYLEALRSGILIPADAHTLVVTGPLMSKGKRELLQNIAHLSNLTMLEFTHDLISYMAAADLTVSMAGYNTVREALFLNSRLLLIPRIRPRVEQLMRAERLAKRGLARYINPDELTPSRLAGEIQISLESPRPIVDLHFNGLEMVSQIISNLLAGNLPTRWVAKAPDKVSRLEKVFG